jgi:hypothetical protein
MQVGFQLMHMRGLQAIAGDSTKARMIIRLRGVQGALKLQRHGQVGGRVAALRPPTPEGRGDCSALAMSRSNSLQQGH